MNLRSLLRKRVHVHLSDPSLPHVEAAADDAPRAGISTSVGTLLGVAGLAVTLIGGCLGVNSALSRQDARIEAGAKERDLIRSTMADNKRQYDAEVVKRGEIDSRIVALQQGQLQIYSTLLNRECSK